jgi:hypothetical protein
MRPGNTRGRPNGRVAASLVRFALAGMGAAGWQRARRKYIVWRDAAMAAVVEIRGGGGPGRGKKGGAEAPLLLPEDDPGQDTADRLAQTDGVQGGTMGWEAMPRGQCHQAHKSSRTPHRAGIIPDLPSGAQIVAHAASRRDHPRSPALAPVISRCAAGVSAYQAGLFAQPRWHWVQPRKPLHLWVNWRWFG